MYTKLVPRSADFPFVFHQNGARTNYGKTWAWNDTRVGTRVHDFRGKISRAEDATSPYSADQQKISDMRAAGGGYSFQSIYGGESSERISGYAWAVGPTLSGMIAHPPLPDPKNEALARFYEALRKVQTEFSGASFMAEFAGTVRMFTRPYAGIVDLFNKHVNLLLKRSKGLTKDPRRRPQAWHDIIASTWLETAFGLNPLISDAAGIAEALARFRAESELNPKLPGAVRARSLVDTSLIGNFPQLFVGGSTLVSGQSATTSVRRHQFTAGLKGQLTADYGSLDRLREILGFNPQDFVPALYEALPWSWLLDYFSNLGDLVNAASTSTASVAWINETASQKTHVTYTSQARPPTVPWWGTGLQYSYPNGGGSFKVVRTTMVRQPLVSLPSMTLELKHPFGNWGKIANMTAVVVLKRPRTMFPQL